MNKHENLPKLTEQLQNAYEAQLEYTRNNAFIEEMELRTMNYQLTTAFDKKHHDFANFFLSFFLREIYQTVHFRNTYRSNQAAPKIRAFEETRAKHRENVEMLANTANTVMPHLTDLHNNLTTLPLSKQEVSSISMLRYTAFMHPIKPIISSAASQKCWGMTHTIDIDNQEKWTCLEHLSASLTQIKRQADIFSASTQALKKPFKGLTEAQEKEREDLCSKLQLNMTNRVIFETKCMRLKDNYQFVSMITELAFPSPVTLIPLELAAGLTNGIIFIKNETQLHEQLANYYDYSLPHLYPSTTNNTHRIDYDAIKPDQSKITRWFKSRYQNWRSWRAGGRERRIEKHEMKTLVVRILREAEEVKYASEMRTWAQERLSQFTYLDYLNY